MKHVLSVNKCPVILSVINDIFYLNRFFFFIYLKYHPVMLPYMHHFIFCRNILQFFKSCIWHFLQRLYALIKGIKQLCHSLSPKFFCSIKTVDKFLLCIRRNIYSVFHFKYLALNSADKSRAVISCTPACLRSSISISFSLNSSCFSL